MEYNLSFGTLLVLGSLLHRPCRAWWYYVTLVLLSIAAPAQHEIAGTLLCGLLFAGSVFRRLKKLPARHWYVSLAVSALSEAVVVLAPGNALRAAHAHSRLWDFAHLPKWVAHGFYHSLSWPASPAILVAACCIVVVCQSDQGAAGTDSFPPRWVGVGALCGMLFVVCEVVFVEFSTGVWLPYRVTAWFQFVFWLLFVCLICTAVPDIYQARLSLGARIGVFTLFGMTLLGSANFRAAVEDLRGPVQSWWGMQSQRLRQHGGTLTFGPIGHYPNLTFHQNLSADPGCFVNVCLAHYLHADAVVVPGSDEQCPE